MGTLKVFIETSQKYKLFLRISLEEKRRLLALWSFVYDHPTIHQIFYFYIVLHASPACIIQQQQQRKH